MVLVVGGTGLLGSMIVEVLRSTVPVRVLTRTPDRHRRDGVEYVAGDLRDPDSVRRALRDVDTVVCTAHGGDSARSNGPRHIEGEAVPRLIEAASGVRQFVYISSASARSDSPAMLFRLKAAVERQLQDTRDPYVILRPTHLLDTWVDGLGKPLVTRGQAMVLGSGRNPVSFVAADDIAGAAATLALGTGRHRLDLGGPTAHTLLELNQTIATVFGVTVRRTMRMPTAALRAASILMRPFAEVAARRMELGALLDSQPQVVDSAAAWRQLGITPTAAADWIAAHATALRHQWQGQDRAPTTR